MSFGGDAVADFGTETGFPMFETNASVMDAEDDMAEKAVGGKKKKTITKKNKLVKKRATGKKTAPKKAGKKTAPKKAGKKTAPKKAGKKTVNKKAGKKTARKAKGGKKN